MKKQTISAILTAVMICLVLAIVVLVIRIGMRGPKPEEDAVSDNAVTSQEPEVSENVIPEPEVEELPPILVAVPQATSSVNVRSGQGTEYERIGSAYSDCEYEVIEIYSSGWTKLVYEGQEGYISNEFLVFKYKVTDANGNVLQYTDVDISELEITESSVGAEETENTEEQ